MWPGGSVMWLEIQSIEVQILVSMNKTSEWKNMWFIGVRGGVQQLGLGVQFWWKKGLGLGLGLGLGELEEKWREKEKREEIQQKEKILFFPFDSKTSAKKTN